MPCESSLLMLEWSTKVLGIVRKCSWEGNNPWHVMQVILYVGYQSRIAVQLKLLLWPAVLAYALEVYTWALMVAGDWGVNSSVALVYLVIGALQLAAVLGAAGISPFMCAHCRLKPLFQAHMRSLLRTVVCRVLSHSPLHAVILSGPGCASLEERQQSELALVLHPHETAPSHLCRAAGGSGCIAQALF